MKLTELVQAHAELKAAIQEYNGGLVQPRDDVVAAILLAVRKAEEVEDSQHFLGVATLDTLESIEKLLQKARDSGGTVED